MSTRDEYRRMAQSCLGWAKNARNAAEQKLLLELADGYMFLAGRIADRLHHGTAHRAADRDPGRYSDDG